MEKAEGCPRPVFGCLLPADSVDGKLDWHALLAESSAAVAAHHDPVAYIFNTRTDTHVRITATFTAPACQGICKVTRLRESSWGISASDGATVAIIVSGAHDVYSCLCLGMPGRSCIALPSRSVWLSSWHSNLPRE